MMQTPAIWFYINALQHTWNFIAYIFSTSASTVFWYPLAYRQTLKTDAYPYFQTYSQTIYQPFITNPLPVHLTQFPTSIQTFKFSFVY